MKTRRETAGHLAAVITIIIWGTTFVSTKVLLEDFPPVDILFYRFLIGLIVLIMVHPHVLTFRSLEARSAVCGSRFMRSEALLSVGKHRAYSYLRLKRRHDRRGYSDDHRGIGAFSPFGRKAGAPLFHWVRRRFHWTCAHFL